MFLFDLFLLYKFGEEELEQMLTLVATLPIFKFICLNKIINILHYNIWKTTILVS